MKTSGRVLTATLLAVVGTGYAVISSAGPHGGHAGFQSMNARFGAGFINRGTMRVSAGSASGISGGGTSAASGISGGGHSATGISGGGSAASGISGGGTSAASGISGGG